jgi:GntR family transcriptional regulator
MRSEPKSGRPRLCKYQTIREWLTTGIFNGRFACGEQLPSEHQLMDRFAVSRVTARLALNDLVKLGVVKSLRGKGYFVKRPIAIHNLERLQSFGEMMAPLGLVTSSKVLEVMETSAGGAVGEALKLSSQAAVTRIVRARLAGGSAISLDVSYFPVEIGRQLVQLDLVHEDIFHLLEKRLRIELGFADLSIEIVPIAETYARHLALPAGDPGLFIRRVTFDCSGRPIDFEQIYAPIDAAQFRLRVPRL